jgi:hypothetical protein
MSIEMFHEACGHLVHHKLLSLPPFGSVYTRGLFSQQTCVPLPFANSAVCFSEALASFGQIDGQSDALSELTMSHRITVK